MAEQNSIKRRRATRIVGRLTADGKLSPEYMVWTTMIQRCHNTKNKKYSSYGGRGIQVCERWRASFCNFLEDVGKRPSDDHQIDRHPNNDGNYEPGNVRWATRKENLRNTRKNRFLIHDGKTLSIAEWSQLTGLDHDCITWRIEHGWSIAEALATPSSRQ